jgi:membrane protease YdiL (CAAX protease family)
MSETVSADPRDKDDWRGVLRPGRLLGLRAVAWGFALVAAIALTSLPFNLLRKAVHAPKGSALSYSLLVLMLLAMLAVYAAAVRWGERRRADELALPYLGRDLAAGIAVGAIVFALVMAVLIGAGWYRVSAGPPGPPWSGLAVGFGAGVFEELVFRGVLMRLVWEAFGLRVALVVSALVFGLAHLLNPGHDWTGPVYIVFEAGLLLGGLYALTGRLWASIGAHAGWNFTQGYLFGAEVSGTDVNGHWLATAPAPGVAPFLTGGHFGPEASLGCLAVGTLAGIAVLTLTYRRRQAVLWGGR